MGKKHQFKEKVTLPLFGKILQAKSSHFNRNLCDWEFYERMKYFTTKIVLVQVGHVNLPRRKLVGLKVTSYCLKLNFFGMQNFTNVTTPYGSK